MTCLARILSLGIIVASLGCGKESLPTKPQLIVDRESLGFGQEFGSGVYIGTVKTDTIQLTNGGLEDLVFESALYTGDQAFVPEGPVKTTLKGKQTTFIRIFFTPTAEKVYTGSLMIVSNAEDNPATKSSPMKKIDISGRGFKPGTDGG
jgi:hypothetical protein